MYFFQINQIAFKKTVVCETGLRDFHMLIATAIRSIFKKLFPKTVKYRSYKNFNETVFLQKFRSKSNSRRFLAF